MLSNLSINQKGTVMVSEIIEGRWKQIRGALKERWGELTDDDVDQIRGEWDNLVGKLQEKYGYKKEQAEAEISEFLENLGSEE
jgi:uncharacterized protein YjbJ (UPF0337 family)